MPIAYPDEIMCVLGFPASKSGMTGLDLSRRIQVGLPFQVLNNLTAQVFSDDDRDKWLIVSKRQYSRLRSKPTAKLSQRLSAKLARLASVWALAKKVWGSDEAARNFLLSKHMLLEQKRPIDIAIQNEFGAEVVAHILCRLQFGTAA